MIQVCQIWQVHPIGSVAVPAGVQENEPSFDSCSPQVAQCWGKSRCKKNVCLLSAAE